MLVTDKQFYMEPRLVKKLDLMIDRMKIKMDNVLTIDGDEGVGKTNLEVGIGYYISDKTGRPFSVDNIFFDLDELIDFAIKTEEQIICWDEAALGGMAQEWWRKNQVEFIKLLMIARKKKHFFIICIPKFFKLNEYLIVDRSIALIHVYARREIQRGRFVYYTKKKKEKLYYDWKKKRQRNYKKFVSFRGSFLEYLPKVLDEKAYEVKKNYAILNFRKDTKDVVSAEAKKKIEMETEERLLANLCENAKKEGISQKKIANWVKMNIRTLEYRLSSRKKATTTTIPT